MLVKTAFEGHGCTCHGVLEALNGAVMALTGCRLAGLLPVVLNQGLQLAAAGIQGAGKIQRDVRGMVVVRLTELIGPVVEQLPFVSTFFWNLNRVSEHIYSAYLGTWMLATCFGIPLCVLTRQPLNPLTRSPISRVDATAGRKS